MSATILSRHLRRTLSPITTFFIHNHHHLHRIPRPTPTVPLPRPFSSASASSSFNSDEKVIERLLDQVKYEKDSEREARMKAGLDTADIDAEEHEDDMNVGPLIAKLEKQNLKDANSPDLYLFEEPSDSDSDEDDDRFTREEMERSKNMFEKKFKRHKELLNNFVDAGNSHCEIMLKSIHSSI